MKFGITSFFLIFLVITSGCVQNNKRIGAVAEPLKKQDINSVIHNLAQQITSTMLKKNKKKVAVTHFLTIRGELTDLGLFLSDKLTNSLFQYGDKFEVVERSRMEALQEEILLGFSGVIDDDTAQDLGKATGADAIVIGTITDLVDNVDVSLRMLGTERANVIAVATVNLEKSPAVESLLASIKPRKKQTKKQIDPSPSKEVKSSIRYKEIDKIGFSLKRCDLSSNVIDCHFTITNNRSNDTKLAITQATLHDQNGIRFNATGSSIGGHGTGFQNEQVIISGVATSAHISFNVSKGDTEEIAALQFNAWGAFGGEVHEWGAKGSGVRRISFKNVPLSKK